MARPTIVRSEPELEAMTEASLAHGLCLSCCLPQLCACHPAPGLCRGGGHGDQRQCSSPACMSSSTRLMQLQAAARAPLPTATDVASTRKKCVEAMGGRTIYSGVATYSTLPRHSSGRSSASFLQYAEGGEQVLQQGIRPEILNKVKA